MNVPNQPSCSSHGLSWTRIPEPRPAGGRVLPVPMWRVPVAPSPVLLVGGAAAAGVLSLLRRSRRGAGDPEAARPQPAGLRRAPGGAKGKLHGAFVPSHRPPRHRRGVCSTAWRRGALAARLSRRSRVVAEKRVCEIIIGASDSPVDLRAGSGPLARSCWNSSRSARTRRTRSRRTAPIWTW